MTKGLIKKEKAIPTKKIASPGPKQNITIKSGTRSGNEFTETIVNNIVSIFNEGISNVVNDLNSQPKRSD